jgi:hypothetical protein
MYPINHSLTGLCCFLFMVGCIKAQHLKLSLLSTFATAGFEDGASEIVTYDPCSKKVFSTNSHKKQVDILGLSSSGVLRNIAALDLNGYGINPTSVAVNSRRGYFAVSGINAANATSTGSVVFFKTSDFSFIGSVTVGAVPDMITFASSGTRLLVANEGEVDGDSDPEGSVSIISDIELNPFSYKVSTVEFTQYNGQEVSLRAQGIRIFPGVSASVDFEPEYISVYGNIAYVTLQENNAVAVIDIEKARILRLLPLGLKDHSITGNGLDTNDNDKVASIGTKTNLVGMYMPDAIAAYAPTWGAHHFVTANEGDIRKEGTAVFALENLDPVAFPDSSFTKSDASMGRLVISSIDGLNAAGNHTKLYTYGTRSFSIFNQQGRVVFDSGDDFEKITAAKFPGNFNAGHDEVDMDSRSDNKGPEPEALAVGSIKGFTYAFIGLERIGGVMVRQ